MVVYECERCHKKFNHKGNYNAHINRKKPCNISNKESKEVIVNSIIKESIDNKCMYCNQVFSRADSLKRHLLNYCENRNRIIMQNDDLKKENEKLREEMENFKKNSDAKTIINNVTKIENNNQMIINQNIQNNININAFGKEKNDFISTEDLTSIVKHPENGIPKLIRMIHFNPLYPENQNVKLKNKKEPYLNVFNGKQWELKNKEETIHSLIASKKEIADEYFDSKIDNIHELLISKRYEAYTDAIDEYLNSIVIDDDKKSIYKNKYKRLYDKLFKQVNLILLNHYELTKSYKKKIEI